MITNNEATKNFIYALPKAELHVHIEGTMEPEQYLLFAERNKISVPHTTLEQAQRAYEFSDYQSFINAYLQIANVLCTQEDFYDLTIAYLTKAYSQGVLHAEIFFDMQTYMPRNIPISAIVNGIHEAILYCQKHLGISAEMIMCFIRNLSQENAFEALKLSLPYKDKIVGVGLASLETGNPPSKFKDVFALARSMGYHCVAHAGECSAAYILDAINVLHVERIDHGIHVVEDPSVMQKIIEKKIPLTLCPLSNQQLGVAKNLTPYPLKQMLNEGALVTINSDDPAFFNSYIADNYYFAFTESGLSIDDLISCARNSFQASFTSQHRKEELIEKLENFITQ